MKPKKSTEAMSGSGNKHVDEAIGYKKKTKKPTWIKWGAMAACLCLVAGLAIPMIFYQSAKTPNDTANPGNGPSSLTVNGVNYLISSYLSVSVAMVNITFLCGAQSTMVIIPM